MWSRQTLAALLGATLGTIAVPIAAWGHGAHIASRTTEAVQITATYDSGQPMAGAQVQVYAPGSPEEAFISGTTDAQGRFTFSPTGPGDWEVSVRQAGHGDIAVIPVSAGGAIAETTTASTALSPLQRGIMAGAVTWGCIGTALFFRRGKR